MAGETVIAGRGMFPQEWATFFGMTAIARIVAIQGVQQFVAEAAVRVVAVATGHFPCANRMAGNTAGFGSFGLVAAKTDAGLLGFLAYRVLGAMQGVAGCTG